jgi:hypothetical protein
MAQSYMSSLYKEGKTKNKKWGENSGRAGIFRKNGETKRDVINV